MWRSDEGGRTQRNTSGVYVWDKGTNEMMIRNDEMPQSGSSPTTDVSIFLEEIIFKGLSLIINTFICPAEVSLSDCDALPNKSLPILKFSLPPHPVLKMTSFRVARCGPATAASVHTETLPCGERAWEVPADRGRRWQRRHPPLSSSSSSSFEVGAGAAFPQSARWRLPGAATASAWTFTSH